MTPASLNSGLLTSMSCFCYGSSTVPFTSWFRPIASQRSVTVKSRLVKLELDSMARTASSIFCCDVTPTDLRNLRMDKLKLSSLIAISYVMITMTCLNVTRWCQLIRKTIKLLIGSWLSALLISQPQAYALSLSHDRAVPANLIQYIVPRFALKTRIRFDRVETAGDLRLVIQQSEHGV